MKRNKIYLRKMEPVEPKVVVRNIKLLPTDNPVIITGGSMESLGKKVECPYEPAVPK